MAENVTRRDTAALQALTPGATVVVSSTGNGAFEQMLLNGRHTLLSDEPRAVGGNDVGPGPYEFLLMSLGSCTSMTLHMYAGRKKWPLAQVVVRLRHSRVHAEDCADCEKPTARIDRIEREIEVIGALDAGQRSRLLEIANQCPVHRTLSSRIDIKTTAVRQADAPS
jgi:putative redox protein